MGVWMSGRWTLGEKEKRRFYVCVREKRVMTSSADPSAGNLTGVWCVCVHVCVGVWERERGR